MTSDKLAELVWRHADSFQNLAQGALGHVLAAVDRYGDGTSVRMPHEVVAALDPRDGEANAL